MSSVAAPRLVGRRPPVSRWRDLVLGPPLATSRLVRERVRPDTEVTVLLPRHRDRGRFRRLLHDQTGQDLFDVLNRLAGVSVAIVHPRPWWPSTRPWKRPPDGPRHEFPASRYARRRPDLRS